MTRKEIEEKYVILRKWTDRFTNLPVYHVKSKELSLLEKLGSITYYIQEEPNNKMGIPEFIIKKTIEQAEKSDHKQKVGACIFKKGNIYSIGRNYSSKSIKHIHPRFLKYPTSVHAEVDAIIKARKDISGCSILVIRINKKKELLLAKPCKKCLTYIDFCGIKNIYYSNNEGDIERMKI